MKSNEHVTIRQLGEELDLTTGAVKGRLRRDGVQPVDVIPGGPGIYDRRAALASIMGDERFSAYEASRVLCADEPSGLSEEEPPVEDVAAARIAELEEHCASKDRTIERMGDELRAKPRQDRLAPTFGFSEPVGSGPRGVRIAIEGQVWPKPGRFHFLCSEELAQVFQSAAQDAQAAIQDGEEPDWMSIQPTSAPRFWGWVHTGIAVTAFFIGFLIRGAF